MPRTAAPASVERAGRAIASLAPEAQARFRQALSFDTTGRLAHVFVTAIASGPLIARGAREQLAFAAVLSSLSDRGVRAAANLVADATSPFWHRDARVGSVVEAALALLETPLAAWPHGGVTQAQLVADVLSVLALGSGRRPAGFSAASSVLLQRAPHRLLHLLAQVVGDLASTAVATSTQQAVAAATGKVTSGATTPGDALRRAYAYAANLTFVVHKAESPALTEAVLRQTPLRPATPIIVDVERGPLRSALELEQRRGATMVFRDRRGAVRSASIGAVARLVTHLSLPSV